MNNQIQKVFLTAVVMFFSITLFAQFTEQQKITNPAPSANMQFGESTDISGDYAISGAKGEDDFKGAAYVFHFDGTTWTKVARLTASDGSADDYFGKVVAIDGDNVVVGVDKKTAAYVFTKPASGWADMTETAKLTASDAQSGDNFGGSISISGNYIIIGDLYQDNGGNLDDDKGAAYIFQKPATGWTTMTETQKIIASGLVNEDYFGCDVAIHEDYCVVGAKGDDSQANYNGAAYVFYNNAGTWEEKGKLTASDAEASDGLGYTVDIYGDYIIASAYWKNVNGTGSGAAYVFTKPASGWTTMTQTAKLTPSDGVEYDYFSCHIAITDKYAIASAHYEHNGGQVYLYEMPETGWVDATENSILTASSGATVFGKSLSLTNDKLIIGDFGDASYSGAIYIFENPTASVENFKLNNKLSVFPNPSCGKFSINIDPEFVNSKITVSDITGKNIYNSKVTGGLMSFNVENIKKGVYFLNINSTKGTFTRKIVIQ